MSTILSLPDSGDYRSESRQVVDFLSRGELVVLPGETEYLICGQPFQPEPFLQWPDAKARQEALLIMNSAGAAHDYLPSVPQGNHLQRLIERVWPGPLDIQIPQPDKHSLLEQFPQPVRELLLSKSWLRLGCPAQQLIRNVTESVPWPLLAMPTGSTSLEELVEKNSKHLACAVRLREFQFTGQTTVAAFDEGRITVPREGIVGSRTIQQLASLIVLFVCTGNTCRSPMAEVLFRHLLSQELGVEEDKLLERGVSVLSAGLATAHGLPASPDACQLMQEAGLDLSTHQSQPVTPQLLSIADFVITMTKTHQESILARFPVHAERIQLLRSDGLDISDPFGGGMSDYIRCRDEIQEHLGPLVKRIVAAI